MDTEVQEAILTGEIIEEYPDEKNTLMTSMDSCLIYDHTLRGRPLHVQCSVPLRVRLSL